MTDDPERRAREVDNLRAVYQSLQPGARPSEPRSRVGRGVAAGAVGGGLLFVLGKAKLLGLLAGVFKFKTLATMLLSIGAYAIEWGWAFAAGFVLLTLFNLVPVPPLDGGRIAGAFTRTSWVIGYAVGAVAPLLTRSPLLLIVLIVGLFTLVRRWRDPVPGYDALPPRQRATIALAYVALVVALLVTLPLHD